MNISTVYVGDKMTTDLTLIEPLEGVGDHHGSQMGPPNTNVNHIGKTLPGRSCPQSAMDLLHDIRHL